MIQEMLDCGIITESTSSYASPILLVQKKTEAVEKFKVPSNQHEIRQFVGLASFFRRFVKDFAINPSVNQTIKER